MDMLIPEYHLGDTPDKEYYRKVYQDSKRITGKEDLTNKKVVVFMEQGLGDNIQFLRYINILNLKNCEIILHIASALHSIIENHWPYVKISDRFKDDPPEHDYHILSTQLPFFLGISRTEKDLPPLNQCSYNVPLMVNETYIKVKDKKVEKELPQGKRVGIAWEGSPMHPENETRCCPLEYFKKIQDKGYILCCLQDATHNYKLMEGCKNVELWGTELKDFMDTAKFINCVDFVVSVDTAVSHLAGAMGKKVYCLVSADPDPRWGSEGNRTSWYPTMTLVRQSKLNDWEGVFNKLMNLL